MLGHPRHHNKNIYNAICQQYKSFLHFLSPKQEKGKQKQHKFLYWEFYEQGGKIAVRKGDWKLVVLNVLKNKNTEPELYNLATDIHEDNNVAKQYPEVVKGMLKIMKTSHVDSEIFKFNSETKFF